MAHKNDYFKEIGLKHHEVPAKVDLETGEVKIISKKDDNIPEDYEIFEPDAYFQKHYTTSWQFLRLKTSNIEFAAATRLAIMAKANTNSLQPLNDESTIETLVHVLGVSKNKVNLVLRKLFDLGVYGKFEVSNKAIGYHKYWVFNPYLSFSGQLIKSDIANLFRGTEVASAFYNPEYGKTPKVRKRRAVRYK